MRKENRGDRQGMSTNELRWKPLRKKELGAGTGPGTGGHVHGHLQIHGNSKFAVGQGIDADDFRQVFRSHGIMRRRIREGDEDAHAFVIIRPLRDEVYAVLRGVDAVWQIFKVIVARFRRTNAHWPCEFGAASTTKL